MINSFICMTLARIGWLSSVPPVGWAVCFLKVSWLCFVSRIVWNMWWWFLFLPMRRRAVWVSTLFCTMEFTGKCGRSMFCRWGIIVIGMRWLWGLFCCKEKYVDFVSQVSGVTLSADIYYFAHEDILLFSVEYGYWSCSIGNTLKNPSKASACSQTPYPWAFRLKDWVQESFSWGWNVSAELIFLRFLGNRFSWRIFSGWNISQCISFSRNADRQGVCGVAERSEGKVRRFGM